MRYAASLIVVRYREELEVLVVRRSEQHPFLSGYSSFPGGMSESVDHDEDQAQMLRNTAIREFEEELGVTATQIGLYTNDLVSLGYWNSPPYLGAPFQTHYFMVVLDDDFLGKVKLSRELNAVGWHRPHEILSDWESHNRLLAPPTLNLLKQLSTNQLPDAIRALNTVEVHQDHYAQVRPHIAMFPQPTPTLPPATHTNAYLVGDKELILVEPAAHPFQSDCILIRELESRIENGACLKAIVLTHHHHDHCVNLVRFSERFSAPIWAHREAAERVPFSVDHHLCDGDRISLCGGTELSVLHTPGHAPGHLVLFCEGSQTLIAGDMVAGIGTILIDPDDDGCMLTYLNSLEKLIQLNPSCLLPSHGPPIGGAVHRLSAYIKHRLSREELIVDAIKQSDGTLVDIVNRAYRDVPEILRAGPDGGICGRSTRAHLEKLVLESRVSGSVQDGFYLI